MADTMLDYGAPDGEADVIDMDTTIENNPAIDPREAHLQDASMDAEMQEWEEGFQGTEEEFEEERRKKKEELLAGHRTSTKFYALPLDQAVEAGAKRGINALPALADDELMGNEIDSIVPDVPGTIGKGLDIRFNALHITGPPISQCSTSRLFAYITHYGAQPLGLEWINDHSCNVVFSDVAAAKMAVEYLCPANSSLLPLPSQEELEQAARIKQVHDSGEDINSSQEHEWNEQFMHSILSPRRAHRIPGKLYNATERDSAKALQEFINTLTHSNSVNGINDPSNGASSTVPEIYREMEEEDRKNFSKQREQVALESIRSNLYIRWTVESLDVKESKSAQQSKWYRDHGRDAGKEVIAKVLQVGGADERKELLSSGDRRRRGKGVGRGGFGSSAAMDELDREMEAYRDRADDAVVGGDPEARRRRRRGSRSAGTMAAVDEEMERRDRSASPTLRSNDSNGGSRSYKDASDGTTIRVRGRGRMRAPSAWKDERDLFDGRQQSSGLLSDRLRIPANTSRMSKDGIEEARHSSNLANRLQLPAQSLDQRLSPSNTGGNLQDRLR